MTEDLTVPEAYYSVLIGGTGQSKGKVSPSYKSSYTDPIQQLGSVI
jgi:hypothetical protein